MKVSLLTVVALATVAFCSAADPECKYRRIRGLPMHWADPSDCGRFYRCNKSVKREVICPDKKEYSQKTGKCVNQGRGTCKMLSMMPALDAVDNPCADQVSGAYVAEAGSCRNFYICNNNVAYPQFCDAGSYFSPTAANCQPDEDKTCWQNKCMDQADGTYLADANSCSQFYICHDKDALQQSCGTGSYFNATQANCIPDENGANCSDNLCVSKPDGTFVKDVTNCHDYYICQAAKAVKQECPEGSYFDWTDLNCQPGKCPDDETTVAPPCTDEPVTEPPCTEGPVTEEPVTEEPCTEGPVTIPPITGGPVTEEPCTEEPITVPPITGGPATDAPCAEAECPDGSKEGDFVPNPDNCMLFYICTEGKLVESSCYEGNYFEPQIGVCMPDTDGKCPQCTASYRAKRSADEASPEAIEIAKQEEVVQPDCLGLYFEGQMVKDTDDCRKFQVCFEGEMVTQDCGEGNFFSELSSVCQLDTENACPAEASPEELVDPAPAATDDCTCPGGYAAGSLLPNPNSCYKYYKCAEGILVDQACVQGSRFDANTGVCVPDTANTCWPADPCKGQSNNAMVPDPQQCNSFFLCLNGVGNPDSCAPGQWFNPEAKACEPDTNAACLNPCNGTTGIVFLPHPDCTKFYFCNDGLTNVDTCSAGQGFDVTLGFCHNNAVCEATMCKGQQDGQTFPVVGEPDRFYLCLDELAYLYDCDPGTVYNVQVGICLAAPSKDCDQTMCVGGNTDVNAFSPLKPGDDTAFCYCRPDGAYLDHCQNQYVFSPEHGVCYSNAPCDPELCFDHKEYFVSANRNDTSSFCLCVMKQQVIVDCPEGGTFNAATLLCQPTPEQSPNCNPTYCLTEPDYTIFPALNNNNKGFCVCLGMGSEFVQCSAGYTFDTERLICMPIEEAGDCNVAVCQSGDTTFFPLASDPNGFCYCVSTTKVVKESCSPGETFSPEHLVCLAQTEACNVQFCASGSTTYFPAFNDPSSFCYCQNTNTVIKEACPKGTVFNTVKLICLPDPCSKTYCTNPANDGLNFPANDEPTGFCRCEGTTAVFMSCEKGYSFDPAHLVCLPTANTECNIALCKDATAENTYPIPAIDDPTGFCYCFAPDTVFKFSCNDGWLYDNTLGICVGDEPLPTSGPEPTSNPQPEDPNACTCPGGYKQGQMLPNPSNCQKYYICADSKLQDSDCGIGNYFNKATNQCARDTTGACIPATDCTCVGAYNEGEYLAHPSDKQLYYICANAQLHRGDCGAGNIFDVQTALCTPAVKRMRSADVAVADDDLICTNNEKRSVPSNCSQYELCLAGNWSKRRTCPHLRYYNPEQKKCLEPRDDTVCAYARVSGLPACNNGTMSQRTWPSKNGNCSQYYRCKEGKWQLKACPKKLYYSRYLHTCISTPNEHVCAAANVTTQSAVSETASRCRHTAVRAYAANCAMYLMCLEGEWWQQYCPLGMYFNRTQNYCVPNDAAQCSDASEPASGNVSALPAAGAHEFANQNCSSEGALRPSALACDRYYVCVAGKWHQQNCTAAQYYNVAEQACVADVDNICADLSAACAERDRRAFPLNCTTYEVCEQGAWKRANCQTGWAFDDVLNACAPNEGSCAANGLRKACHEQQTRSLPLAENCTQFYYCEDNSWRLATCLKGHTFIATLHTCVPHAATDKCKSALAISELQDYDAVPIISANISETNSSCIEREDGVAVPHPTDCSRFYLCVHELAASEQRCDMGGFFDPELGYCRPNIDGACRVPQTGACINATTEGALLQNKQDCRSYYRCSFVNGTQLFSCPEGQYYHNYTRQCRVDHGECQPTQPQGKCAGVQQHGTRLPHEQYCNIYYACVRGLAIPVECPDGHQFNALLARCIPDTAHECVNGELINGNNNTYSCGNLTDGAYLPDRSDCTRYFICSEGVALPKRCGKDSFFDSQQLLCVPDDDSCPFVDDDQTNHQPVPPDPIVCEDGRNGKLMPDPLNCNDFYVCLNGKLRHERCYDEHFFNTTTYQCQQYNEEATNTPDPTEPGADDDSKSAIKTQQCTDKPTDASELCSHIAEGASIAEQGDCRRYISCEDNEPMSQRCRNGESYDSLLGFCRQNDGTCLLENGQRVGECNKRHGQLARDADNCRAYFVCINGQKIASECAEDEYFNRTQNVCMKDVDNQCSTSLMQPEEAAVSCKGLSETVLYPYINDKCRSYFQCVKGVPKVHECSDGLYYNATIVRCVKEVSECVMPALNLLRAPDIVHTQKKICDNAVIAHPYANLEDHCHSYYVCLKDGSVTYTTCPAGTLYNTETGDCDEAKDVICRI